MLSVNEVFLENKKLLWILNHLFLSRQDHWNNLQWLEPNIPIVANSIAGEHKQGLSKFVPVILRICKIVRKTFLILLNYIAEVFQESFTEIIIFSSIDDSQAIHKVVLLMLSNKCILSERSCKESQTLFSL